MSAVLPPRCDAVGRRPLVPLLLLLALASCARSDDGDAEARRIVEEWTGVGDRSESVARFYEHARRGCNQGRGLSGMEYVECQSARLALAEAELDEASRGYEAEIVRRSAYVEAAYRGEVRGEWRTVWAYAQRRWRETREADCTALGFSFTGGSGAGANFWECQADRTFERAAQVRAM